MLCSNIVPNWSFFWSEEVDRLARECRMRLYRTSVKEDINVGGLFQHLAENYVNKLRSSPPPTSYSSYTDSVDSGLGSNSTQWEIFFFTYLLTYFFCYFIHFSPWIFRLQEMTTSTLWFFFLVLAYIIMRYFWRTYTWYMNYKKSVE